MLIPVNASKAQICSFCLRRYYNELLCENCKQYKCTFCKKCNCSTQELRLEDSVSSVKNFTQIKLSSLFNTQMKSNLELSGVLSPLNGQDLIKTKNGKAVLSHYILSDGNYKIPFKIWGSLPKDLYAQRYDNLKVTVTGVKMSRFNGQLQLVLQRNGKIKIHTKKQKSLDVEINKVISNVKKD